MLDADQCGAARLRLLMAAHPNGQGSRMETEPQIVFENMGPSEALRDRVRREIEHLEQFHGRLTACRVVLHAPEKRRRKGNLFNVRVHLVMPGGREVAVRPSAARHQWHEDPKVAIRDAFDAARRQLQDKAKRQRGEVKHLRGRRHAAAREPANEGG
jgi:ribosome-associated translation inhibitor RaiA